MLDQPDLTRLRDAMVASQLRTNAVSDPRVLAAMAALPREAFLPAGASALAYRDTAVALGEGRRANPPMVVGRLLNEAYLRADDRVLLIGAGRGYTAAVLALIVRAVVAVERDPTLAAAARTALAGEPSVTVVEGALAAGHADGAPYDVLVVDGAVEELPTALLDQLTPDARVVAGLLDRGVTRLAAGRRSANGFALAGFADADCVVLPGFARPQGFSFTK